MDVRTYLPGLSESAERRKFIGGSFVLSGAALTQSSKLFEKNNRESLCLLKFHDDWQHQDCAVMQWYELQRVSSTKFKSIQHRRDVSTTFLHEFLILELSDGAVCRIERIGAGSKVDAIRNIGCMANDYIRHFPANPKGSFATNEQSELIAEVHFPQYFDIMDVLAICYVIYRRKRTRAYTLQRFNCYFLCNTILLVLTRRLVPWETAFSLNVWQNTLHESLDRLASISKDDEKKHLLLEVCRLLDPKASVPADFIYGVLRRKLGDEQDAYDSLKQALTGTMWRNSWQKCMKYALARHVKESVVVALGGDSDGAKAFKAAATKKNKFQEISETFEAVNKITDKKATLALYHGLDRLLEATEEQYRMEKIEHPHSVARGLWIKVASHAMGVLFPIELLFQGDMEEWGFKHIFLGSFRGLRIAQSTGVFMCRRLIGISPAAEGEPIRVRGMQLDTTSTSTALVVRANYDMAAQTLNDTLIELSQQRMLSIPSVTVALHGILSKNIWDVWLNEAVGDLLESELQDMIKDEEDGLVVNIPQKDGKFTEIRGVASYQEFIDERIEAHAKRVEDFRLAAAFLVGQDLRAAITEVWMAVPPGFATTAPCI